MSANDEGRKCKINHRKYINKECTFKRFGDDIIYGDDNFPLKKTVAFVECIETKEIVKVEPDQVVFID